MVYKKEKASDFSEALLPKLKVKYSSYFSHIQLIKLNKIIGLNKTVLKNDK